MSAIAPQRVRRALERYERCLPTLSPAARGLLRDRAGLGGPPPATLDRLAAERRTSPAVVRSRIRHAIRDLRDAAARGACQVASAGEQADEGIAAPAGGPTDPVGGPTDPVGGPAPAAGSVHRAASAVPSPTPRPHPTATEKDRSPILGYVTGSSLGLVLLVLTVIGIVFLLIAGASALNVRSHWRHVRSSPRGPWGRQS